MFVGQRNDHGDVGLTQHLGARGRGGDPATFGHPPAGLHARPPACAVECDGANCIGLVDAATAVLIGLAIDKPPAAPGVSAARRVSLVSFGGRIY